MMLKSVFSRAEDDRKKGQGEFDDKGTLCFAIENKKRPPVAYRHNSSQSIRGISENQRDLHPPARCFWRSGGTRHDRFKPCATAKSKDTIR
jgi:hypothetical protein